MTPAQIRELYVRLDALLVEFFSTPDRSNIHLQVTIHDANSATMESVLALPEAERIVLTSESSRFEVDTVEQPWAPGVRFVAFGRPRKKDPA